LSEAEAPHYPGDNVADPEQKSEAPQQQTYTPPSQINPADLAKAFEDEGIIPKSEAPPAPAAPGKTATPEVAKPAATEEPLLLRIARERDAFRKESEPLRPYLDALKVLSPTEAQRLAKARSEGNPVAAMAALGFTHAQYNLALAGLKDEPTSEKPVSEKSGDPELMTLKQELAALKAERDNERVQSSRTQMLGQMKDLLKDNPKFDLINKTGDIEGVERVLIQYHSAHGGLPGSTLEESVTLAAEMYESSLKKEAERWSKVLTGFQGSAPVSGTKVSESPSTGTVQQTRTLTNANTTAPAAVRTVPKTREEVLAAIIEGRDADLEA
jgi:hypothetical protein